MDHTDVFDRVPDPIVLTIFNNISDIKTLLRCRAVSRRFNSLVPQSDSLLLRVDRVIETDDADSDSDVSSILFTFFRCLVKSLQDLLLVVSSPPKPPQLQSPPPRSPISTSPAQILRGFERIRELEIELPSGDLRLEKRAVIKWKSEFGKTLRSCVILGFRNGGGDDEVESGAAAAAASASGLKARVVWTISALIAASARHYMIKDVVKEQPGLTKLTVRDRENEGTMVMSGEGLREYREEEQREEDAGNSNNNNNNSGRVWWRNNRTTVPAVRMRMRHEAKLDLGGGTVRMEGATLVVVRPAASAAGEAEEQSWDAELAAGAFEGVYGEAVEKLLKRRCYLLEMNSF